MNKSIKIPDKNNALHHFVTEYRGDEHRVFSALVFVKGLDALAKIHKDSANAMAFMLLPVRLCHQAGSDWIVWVKEGDTEYLYTVGPLDTAVKKLPMYFVKEHISQKAEPHSYDSVHAKSVSGIGISFLKNAGTPLMDADYTQAAATALIVFGAEHITQQPVLGKETILNNGFNARVWSEFSAEKPSYSIKMTQSAREKVRAGWLIHTVPWDSKPGAEHTPYVLMQLKSTTWCMANSAMMHDYFEAQGF